jgi:hypothetical protein
MASLRIFRQQAEARATANDAMVAMLIATEVSSEFLSGHRDEERLVDIAPTLPSRERLNRSVADSREILGSAEQLLAYMAIPHVLSLHHRTMAEVLVLLRDDGKRIEAERKREDEHGNLVSTLVAIDPYDVGLAEVHQVFARASGANAAGRSAFDQAEMNAFQFARQLRNRLTHQGGQAGVSLKKQWTAARGNKRGGVYRDDGQALWTKLAKRPMKVVRSGEALVLGSGELFATLAVCKRLEDAAEREVVRTLTRHTLADLVVHDYAAAFPQRIADVTKIERRLKGFRERQYPQLSQLDVTDLMDAFSRL